MAKKAKLTDNGILPALRFVQGSIARKDYDPNLCHLLLENGTVTATDSRLTATCPIPLQLTAKPHAKDMLTAIVACDDEDVMSLAYLDTTNRLSVKAGKFRSLVKCLPPSEPFHCSLPAGNLVELSPELMESLRRVAPFMGVDASRTWAMGIRIASNMVYATNNVVLIQSWHGMGLDCDVIVPAAAITEFLRQKEPATHMQVCDRSLTMWYGENKRITTQLVDGIWPANADQIFETAGDLVELSEDFFDALQTLKPFCAETQKVYFLPDHVASCVEEGDGTRISVDMPSPHGCFHISQLLELRGVAERADFSQHPRPCPFQGIKIRGVILGPRQ